MYKVKYGNQLLTFDFPKTLEEIALHLGVEAYVAQVDNRLRELTYLIDYDCTIGFYDLTNTEAISVYQTTLRYLIIMALERVYPHAKISINDYISRSFLGIISNLPSYFNQEILDKIDLELQKIINLNLPIKRCTDDLDSVLKIYQKKNYNDKCAVLKYRQDNIAHYYQCDDYINYMYGYMLPSTGYIKIYRMQLYYPGFIIQYPRSELNGSIPKFEEDICFSRMIKEAREWRMLCGVYNIASMNAFTENRNFVNFVNMCETKHNNMLADLGLKIKENINDIRLIAVAGPSSSGKTTFTNRLRIELMTRGIKPIMISMDDYYLNREKCPLDENNKPDFESLYALDLQYFNRQLLELINGEEVELPLFDFKDGIRKLGNKVKLEKNQPIIIEGIHALNEEVSTLVPKHQKFKIFISPNPQLNIDDHNPISSTDLRLLRRIVRDAKYRKTSPVKTFAMWSSVRRGEFKWIYPWHAEADYVFNSALTYEIMVMKKYAMPALNTITKDDEFFIPANRLLKFLKYVCDIDDKYVPCNSILREFIGESCFYE